MKPTSLLCALAILFSLADPKASRACTAFFAGENAENSLRANPDAFVAKTLDWYSADGMIYVNKRSVRKTGTLIGANPPAQWNSRFASLTLTQSGREFPWEGMNEAGVSVHSLELIPSQVPGAEDPRPALEMLQWIQYVLDTSADLNEAISQARLVRVGVTTTIHYFVCDAGGACAVFEYLGGELVIHAGADLPYRAIANNPYDDSLKYFRSLMTTTTSAAALAGTGASSYDRFSRAALWSTDPAPFDVTRAFTALANVAEIQNAYRTVWSMVFGLKSHLLSLTTLDAPEVKTIDLGSFDPDCASGVEMLDVNARVTGDARAQFVPYSASANRALIERNAYLDASVKPALESYPETGTHCVISRSCSSRSCVSSAQ